MNLALAMVLTTLPLHFQMAPLPPPPGQMAPPDAAQPSAIPYLPGEQEALAKMEELRARAGEAKSMEEQEKLHRQVPEILRDFVKRFPTSPRAAAFGQDLVRMLYGMGDYEGTKSAALDLVNIGTDINEKRRAMLMAFEAFRRCHDDKGAERILRDWRTQHKEDALDPDAVMRMVDLLAETGRFAEGRKMAFDLEAQHAKDPDFVGLAGMLATYLVDNSDADAARTLLESYIKAGPAPQGVAFAKMRLVDVLVHDQRAREAVALAEEMLAQLKAAGQDEEVKQCTLLLGTAHAALARLLPPDQAAAERKKAQETLEQLTGKDLDQRGPIAVQAIAVREDVALEGGQLDVARALLEKMAKVYEGDPIAGLAQKDLQDMATIGKPANRIESKLVGGDAAVVDDFAGKVTVLVYWATWLQASIDELTNLKLMQRSMGGRNVRIYSISTDRAGIEDGIKHFIADNGLTWPQIYDGQGFDSPACTAYGVKAIPQTIVIGPDGKIAREGLSGTHLLDVVRKLAEPPLPAPRHH